LPEPSHCLLVVDDEQSVVDWLQDELREAGYRVQGATSGAAALAAVRERAYDLVISDVEMPGLRGPELLQKVSQQRPSQLVLLMTAFGSIELAVESVRAGACDFLAKPFPIEALLFAIERALRERSMRREIVRLRSKLARDVAQPMLAKSESMRRVLATASKAAQSSAPVLITGESGVGKTVLARTIHEQSTRRAEAFLELNCAALPPQLVESELFGVRRGAFTDAKETRAGLFEQAHGGTLFLDELAEMSLEVQPKLLSALETGRVRAVGAAKERSFSVRIIAATNAPLEQALRERRFRADLYHRLNVLRLDIPPLRERPEDIVALVDVFLHRAGQRAGRETMGVSAQAMRWILAQPWPGNARELSNAIERAVTLSDHDALVVEDFSRQDRGRASSLLDEAGELGMTLEQLETEYLKRVLRKTHGNKTLAAQLLGLDRRTVYRKVAELELDGADEDT